MQLSTANDVQIYNLSAGKSLPKWISSEARRKLEKRNIDVRRRIELIQDFEMPDISHTVTVTPDGRYIFASGAYRPSLKCYDLNDLSIKFERGLDADIIKVLVLSEDYSKLVLLQQDRYLEMHASFGRYFRMRMPRFGRDMAFARECSDLYLVGASSEIYRLNLEQGEWLSPLQSHSAEINCCSFADTHQLFVCGTNDGKVEAWDHRDKSRVAVLDCVLPLLEEHTSAEVTAMQFRDALHLGVGMSTGHVLLFDIRSHRPLLVKDHNYGEPIKRIDYVQREDGDIVMSMDSRVLKMWHEENGKPFAAIESEYRLTDFTRYPNSGLIFFSNEASKLQQHFVPALGPAPKWCSFLETLTEELEETEAPTVYDDYKFVTRQQLEGLGLSHLIGSSVLRAYMHGYFIDSRLYNKAQTLTQPFAYDKYKERKIKDILEEERDTNIIFKKEAAKLPKVNKDIAMRLQKVAESASGKTKDKKKASTAASILEDSRFKRLFESEDFQVDEESEQFKYTAAQKERSQKNRIVVEDEESDSEDEDEHEDDEERVIGGLPDDEEMPADGNEPNQSDLESGSSENEEEEEKREKQREKERRREVAKEKRAQKYVQRKEAEEEERLRRLASKPKKFVLHELVSGETSEKFLKETAAESGEKQVPMAVKKRKVKKAGQLEHIQETEFGGRTMTFALEKKGKAAREEREKAKKEEHQKERREVVRRTTDHVAKNMKRLPSNLNLKPRAK